MDLLKAASVLGCFALASVMLIHFGAVDAIMPGSRTRTSSSSEEPAISLVRAPRLVDYQAGMRLIDRDGKPLFWYAERDGGIELYDAPGFHPRTGERLLPITSEVGDRLKRCKSNTVECF
jgi:hypothetical protein